MDASLDLTILMPCLNEAKTIGSCIQKAQESLKRLSVKGEVLVADNGSDDGSASIAEKMGARVVKVHEKGYGNALRHGIEAACGKWIIMGDADESYDFSSLEPFIKKLREGYDLVMGCRLPSGGGKIKRGAMPWTHRWVGNPVLSFMGRWFFKAPIHDFHCGLRAFSKSAYDRMEMQTTGMEFASEMVIRATLKSMRIAEVPITLYPDGRGRPGHLRTWRDGWRHLRFMLLYSPYWLFFVPGMLLFGIGLFASVILFSQPIRLGGVTLDVGTLAIAAMLLLVGTQVMIFAAYTKVFAISEGLLPQDPTFANYFKYLTLERGIMVGISILILGCAFLINAWSIWQQADYGPLSYSSNLRRVIPSMTLIVLGVQIIFSSFFMSVLGLRTRRRTPPTIEKNEKSGR